MPTNDFPNHKHQFSAIAALSDQLKDPLASASHKYGEASVNDIFAK
jgi:hypothetical protein